MRLKTVLPALVLTRCWAGCDTAVDSVTTPSDTPILPTPELSATPSASPMIQTPTEPKTETPSPASPTLETSTPSFSSPTVSMITLTFTETPPSTDFPTETPTTAPTEQPATPVSTPVPTPSPITWPPQLPDAHLLFTLQPESVGVIDDASLEGVQYLPHRRSVVMLGYATSQIWEVTLPDPLVTTRSFPADWLLDDGDVSWDARRQSLVVALDDDVEGGNDAIGHYDVATGNVLAVEELSPVDSRPLSDDTEDPRGVAVSTFDDTLYVRVCASQVPCSEGACDLDSMQILALEGPEREARSVVTAAQVLDQAGMNIYWMPGLDYHPLQEILISTSSEQSLVAIHPELGEAVFYYDLSHDIGPNMLGISFAPNGDFVVLASLQYDTTDVRLFFYDVTGDSRFD